MEKTGKKERKRRRLSVNIAKRAQYRGTWLILARWTALKNFYPCPLQVCYTDMLSGFCCFGAVGPQCPTTGGRLLLSVCSSCLEWKLPQGSGDGGRQVVPSTATGRHAQNARGHTTGHTAVHARTRPPRRGCPLAAKTVENELISASIAPACILQIEPSSSPHSTFTTSWGDGELGSLCWLFLQHGDRYQGSGRLPAPVLSIMAEERQAGRLSPPGFPSAFLARSGKIKQPNRTKPKGNEL